MKVQELLEGTWALPDTPNKVRLLYDLLEKPRGKNDKFHGEKVEDIIYSIVGDDELCDDIYVIDEEDDVRPVIIKHLPRLFDTRTWKQKPDDDMQFLLNLIRKKHKF